MKSIKHINSMSNPINKGILYLSVPIVIGNIAQTLYGLVDVYWIGQLGTSELAAITLVNPVIQMLINTGMGMTTAASIIVSHKIGTNDDDKIKIILNHIFIVMTIGGGVLFFIIGYMSDSLLTFLSGNAEIITDASLYFRLILIGLEFYFITNIYAALQNSLGNTKIAFYANVIGLIIILILAPLLIIYFKLGILGAGIAGLLSRVIPSLIFSPKLFNYQSPYFISLKLKKINLQIIKSIMKVALPLSFGGAAIQIGFMIMGKNVINFGNQALAAYGIGNKISSLITIPVNSVGNALTIIVGQNFGAKQFNRIIISYRKVRNYSIFYLFILGLILAFDPITTLVAGVFVKDSETLILTISYVKILVIYSFTNGIYTSTIALFNGLGKPRVSVIVDIMRIWLFRLIALRLYSSYFGKTIEVIWYSVVFSNALGALCMYYIGCF